ncbi:MAG: polymer-forming cytoskeletal protein [Candidatus Aminicenantaceae bacterium]
MKFEIKDKKDKKEERYPEKKSCLGRSIFLKGEISGEEDLVIEGEFQGKIDLKNHNLIIEKEGKVNADITAMNISINGEVNGNIYASGRVIIEREGHVDGDIVASRISISDGAQVKGSVKMGKDIEKEFFPKEKIKPLFDQKENEEAPLTSSEKLPE